MPYRDGIETILKGVERVNDDKMFARWIPLQNYVSFEEFKNSMVSQVKAKNESTEEIMEKVKSIIEGVK